MSAARIASIALTLCTCMTFAQEHPKNILTVIVQDPNGALIPGAHITATDQATGLRIDDMTDATGQAAVHLDQGSYELGVVAAGFKGWMEKEIEVKADTYRNVTLPVRTTGACPCVSVGPEMPLERPALAAEIPLMPMQQLVPPTRLLRQRRRWL